MSRSTQGIGSATELCGQDNFCTDRVPDGVEGRARLRELSGFDVDLPRSIGDVGDLRIGRLGILRCGNPRAREQQR